VFCVKCGERVAEFRYCANPNCKSQGARCDDDEIHCRRCGSPTVAQYPQPPEPPKVEEDKTWIAVLSFIAALVMIYLTK
jgi:hypothetical protein